MSSEGGQVRSHRPVAVKAVIFDMDGLMFDTERLAREAWYRAMAEYGYVVDDSTYLTAVGRTVEAACQIFVEALGPDIPIHDIEAAKARHLYGMLIPGPPLKQGLVALLDGIAELGLPTAVASSTAQPEVARRLIGVACVSGSPSWWAETRLRGANRLPTYSSAPANTSA